MPATFNVQLSRLNHNSTLHFITSRRHGGQQTRKPNIRTIDPSSRTQLTDRVLCTVLWRQKAVAAIHFPFEAALSYPELSVETAQEQCVPYNFVFVR